MSRLALAAEGLSKKFRVGAKADKYPTLRDRFSSTLRGRSRSADPVEDEFWALQEVSFEVQAGEVIGIIGANGAGKSTLLKILSRITEPTLGTARVFGRVGSLLEVGTGFHPELSGRENVYLNGAILGMSRSDIDKTFAEIVEFAGVSKFIDTPVKHYSSGMYLRLAFAVAAHLQTEILIVDEVLAVGDAEFQRKCLGKMGDVAQSGRTVLFVSHNLGAVRELCTSTLVLQQGRVVHRGSVAGGLAKYTGQVAGESEAGQHSRHSGWTSVSVGGKSESPAIGPGESLSLEAVLKLNSATVGGHVICIVHDATGNLIVHDRIAILEAACGPVDPGTYHLCVTISHLWLAPGPYTVMLKYIGVGESGDRQRFLSSRLMFEVEGSSIGLSGAVLSPPCAWSMESTAARSSTATCIPTGVNG